MSLVIAVCVVGFGLWFFMVYDTAEGRCGRGDLGACTVLAAQAEAAAAAERQRQEAEFEAAFQGAILAEPERAALGQCHVQLLGHDATVRVSGQNADSVCELFARTTADGEWRIVHSPSDPGWGVICATPYGGPDGEDMTVAVLDTGGAFYGGRLCEELGSF